MKIWKAAIITLLAIALAGAFFYGFREKPQAPAEAPYHAVRQSPRLPEPIAGPSESLTSSEEDAIKFTADVCPLLAAHAAFYEQMPPYIRGMLAAMEILPNARKAQDAVMAMRRSGLDCVDMVFRGNFERGDTMSTILERTSEGEVGHYLNAASKVFPLKSFRDGQPYAVTTDGESGHVKKFEYEINSNEKLVVEGEKEAKARLEEIEYDVELKTINAEIGDSLFQSVADIGENPQIALRIVSLFGSEINFLRDLREGDSFSVVVEKRYRNGQFRDYGRVLAARFKNRGKVWEAFLFRDAYGAPAYYNADGENLHKALLQSPLSVTRVTSRFSHNRQHPILGYSRPHLGVDYGAPTGTPVKAVGDGTVAARGWAGGYGNQIVIKHVDSLESMYSHLSGFARGVRVGGKVKQGQVIGFVGSTGLSTGPHLDFRLRHRGRFINPSKAINPRGAPVPQQLKADFKRAMEMERVCLDGGTIENYTVNAIVKPGMAAPIKAVVEAEEMDEAPRNAKHRFFSRRYPRARYRLKALKHNKVPKYLRDLRK